MERDIQHRADLSSTSRNILAFLFFTCVVFLLIYRINMLDQVIQLVSENGYEIVRFLDSSEAALSGGTEWIRRIALLCWVLFLWIVIQAKLYDSVPRALVFLLLFLVVWRFVLTLISAAFVTGWTYTRLLDPNGLVVMLSGVAIFVGCNVNTWKVFPVLLGYCGLLISVIVVLTFLDTEVGTRAEGIKEFRGYSYLLMATVAFIPGVAGNKPIVRAAAMVLGLAALALIGYTTQTRAIYIFLITLVGAYNFLLIGAVDRGVKSLLYISAVSMIVFGLMSYFEMFEGIVGFRAYDDTRSAQAINFFSKISSTELILGSPYIGLDDRFALEDNIWGIDSGFVCLLYAGGIPLFAAYVMIYVVPVVKCLLARYSPEDAAVVATCFSYLIQTISSEMPSLTEGYLVLLLCSGRAIYLSAFGAERMLLYSR